MSRLGQRGGLAEGVALVAFGDLSPARTAFFIPPACFKPPAADWRKGWDSNPRWVFGGALDFLVFLKCLLVSVSRIIDVIGVS
jgi:hypothetical protein